MKCLCEKRARKGLRQSRRQSYQRPSVLVKSKNKGTKISPTLESKTLILNALGIGDAGATVLSSALKKGLMLQSLELRENGISDQGAQQLLSALQGSSVTIENLDLRGNDLTFTSIPALPGLKAFGFSICAIKYEEFDKVVKGLLSSGIKVLHTDTNSFLPDLLTSNTVSESDLIQLPRKIDDVDTLRIYSLFPHAASRVHTIDLQSKGLNGNDITNVSSYIEKFLHLQTLDIGNIGKVSDSRYSHLFDAIYNLQ